MNEAPEAPEQAQTTPPIAVIDIGATFIRMLIAEKRGAKGIAILEKVVQSVALGRDIVADGRISNATVEQCVTILKSFRHLLDEYKISTGSVTAVATATLDHADNSEVFLDRISTSSHIDFRLLDQGQIGYYYHLAFRALKDRKNKWEKGESIVLEIGGLNCGMLCRKDGEIRFVQTYTVGSLQLRKQMEEGGFKQQQLSALADGRSHEISEQLLNKLEDVKSVKLLLMGREMRFAAARMKSGENGDGAQEPTDSVTCLAVSDLKTLLYKIESSTTEELVKKWRISYPDAELLAPSLSIAISVANSLMLKNVYVSNLSFSHGLLEEAVAGTPWTETMRKHVLRVARETGEKYRYDYNHARKVADISLTLFDMLRSEHECTPRHRLILEVAALLHDIGVFVSVHSHHKHTMYLIRNTEFAGLSSEEIELIAVIARYHRKTIPKSVHPEYSALNREDRLVVSKLAAFLRVADALDRVHDQSLGEIKFELREDTLLCIPSRQAPTSAERVALSEKGDLFEMMYGRRSYLYSPE